MTATTEDNAESWGADGRGEPPRPFQSELYPRLLRRPALRPAQGYTDYSRPVIDAIVVPTIHSAEQLRSAVRLAADSGSHLVTLHTDRFPSELTSVLGKLGRDAVTPLALRPRARHALLDLAVNMPQTLRSASAFDISRKRNFGLLIGRACGWTRMLLLDDDIQRLNMAKLRAAASVLREDKYPVVGIQVTDKYPDASVIGHARRMVGYDHKPFISGASLLVNPQRLNGFFPAVYHDDWLCILDHLRLGEVAVSGQVGQGPYNPFADPDRARSEEFGDVLASGLLWLIHAARDKVAAQAALADTNTGEPSDYWREAMRLSFWKEVLDQRAKLLDELARLLELRPKRDMAPLESVRAAQHRRSELSPDEFVSFITAWGDNLAKWRDRTSHLARAGSVDKAVDDLGLLHTVRLLEGRRAKVRATLAYGTSGARRLGVRARGAFRDDLDETTLSSRLQVSGPPSASEHSSEVTSVQGGNVARSPAEMVSGLGLDTRYFLSRAHRAEHDQMSWLFEGRSAERKQIATWLRSARGGVLVVTGRTGSGKSALLADVLARSLPELRDELTRQGLIDAIHAQEMPPDGVFDAVLHLGGLTVPQIASRLATAAAERLNVHLASAPSAAWTGMDAMELDEIAAQLAAAVGSFTVLVDGLDEAADPLGTARSVLARLTAIPGVRVLIGTRASTREHLDAPADDQEILDALGSRRDALWLAPDPDAIYRFAGLYLRAAQQQADHHAAAGMSVVPEAELDRAAATIAVRNQEFLFARLAVHEITEDPRLLAPELADWLDILLDGSYEGLFAAAVDRLTSLDDRYVALLQALAQAPRPGLSESDWIWAALASVPSAASGQPLALGSAESRPPTDTAWTQEIRTLLERAAPYITSDLRTSNSSDTDGPTHQHSDADDDGTTATYRLAHHAFAQFLAARDTERDPQHLPAFDHAASADIDSYVGEFAEAQPTLEAALQAGRLPCSPGLVTQSRVLARLAMNLWRLTSVHSPAYHRLVGETMPDSQLPEDPLASEQETPSSEQVLPRPAGEPPRSAPQAAGARLEGSVLDLLELLFQFADDDDDRLRSQVRRQQSGTQYGTDLIVRRPTQRLLERGIRFQGAAREALSTCLVECKNYTSAVTMETVSAKLLDAESSFQSERVDHWILISPHQDPNNPLDQKIQQWNSSRRFPFTVQVWSPQTRIMDLFALMPEVYRDLYGEDPPQPFQDPDRVLAAFAERLRPPVRLPEKLAGYIKDASSFVLPPEKAWLDQIESQVTRFGFDEKGTRLPQPLETEVLSALFGPSTSSNVALLLAEFGEGKSFFTVSLCVHLQARYLAKPGSGVPIPIRLPLKGFRHTSSATDFLRTQLELIGLDVRDFGELRRHEKILIILDGLDEMSVRQDPATTRANLDNIESLLGLLEGLPVMVTSRPHFLSAAPDRERFYDRLRRPHVFRMGQPDRRDIVKHLRAFANTPDLARKLDKIIDEMYDPVALASKMLFLEMTKLVLEMTKETLPDLPEGHFDEVTLYNIYVTKTLERKIELLRGPDAALSDRELLHQLEQLLEKIAVAIHVSGEGCVDLRNFTEEAGGAAWLLWKAAAADELQEDRNQDATARISGRSLLRRVAAGPGRYAEDSWLVDFFHRSMKEYFVAKALQRALQAPDPFTATRQLLTKTPVQPEILGFFRLLAEHRDAAAGVLARVARSASVGSESGLAGGGAISLYAAIGGQMRGGDWRSLYLDGALLSGTDLADSDLRGSTLRGADLSSADLTGADLRNCDLTEANLASGSSVIAMSSDTTARHYRCLTSESGLGQITVNADGSLTCSFIRLPRLLQVPQNLFVLEEGLLLIAGRSDFLVIRIGSGSAEEVTRFRISSKLRAVAVVDRSQLGLLIERDQTHSEALLVGIADGQVAWRIPVAPHGKAYGWSASGIAIAYEAEVRAYYPDGSHTSLGPGRQWSGCILSMDGKIPVVVTRDGQVTWLGTDDSPQIGFVTAHQGAGTAATTSGSNVLSAGADGSIALTRRDGNGPPVIVSRLDRRLRCSGAKVKGLRRERERLTFLANHADAN